MEKRISIALAALLALYGGMAQAQMRGGDRDYGRGGNVWDRDNDRVEMISNRLLRNAETAESIIRREIPSRHQGARIHEAADDLVRSAQNLERAANRDARDYMLGQLNDRVSDNLNDLQRELRYTGRSVYGLNSILSEMEQQSDQIDRLVGDNDRNGRGNRYLGNIQSLSMELERDTNIAFRSAEREARYNMRDYTIQRAVNELRDLDREVREFRRKVQAGYGRYDLQNDLRSVQYANEQAQRTVRSSNLSYNVKIQVQDVDRSIDQIERAVSRMGSIGRGPGNNPPPVIRDPRDPRGIPPITPPPGRGGRPTHGGRIGG